MPRSNIQRIFLFKVTRKSKHDDDQNIQVINHNTSCDVREFPAFNISTMHFFYIYHTITRLIIIISSLNSLIYANITNYIKINNQSKENLTFFKENMLKTILSITLLSIVHFIVVITYQTFYTIFW